MKPDSPLRPRQEDKQTGVVFGGVEAMPVEEEEETQGGEQGCCEDLGRPSQEDGAEHPEGPAPE